MATNVYLKKQLATNVPLTVRMKKRVGTYPETDYTTKEPTGRMQTLYVFEDASGNELKHYAKEREEETLRDYQPGQSLTVLLTEKVKDDGKRISFLVWGTPGSAEMTAAPQLRTNTATIKQEQEMDERQHQQRIKEIMISLAGLTQAFISTGKYETGEAIDLAVKARQAIIDKAIDLAS